MHHTIKAGILYSEQNEPLCLLKSVLSSTQKRICLPDGNQIMQTDVLKMSDSAPQNIHRPNHEYVLVNQEGNIICTATPTARNSEVSSAQWPVYCVPGVDHASFIWGQTKYLLVMHNSQNYTLSDTSGKNIVRIFHKGMTGGWNLETDADFPPGVLCGIFAFCRYIEQEDEPVVHLTSNI